MAAPPQTMPNKKPIPIPITIAHPVLTVFVFPVVETAIVFVFPVVETAIVFVFSVVETAINVFVISLKSDF